MAASFQIRETSLSDGPELDLTDLRATDNSILFVRVYPFVLSADFSPGIASH